jgi:hypothetical protein
MCEDQHPRDPGIVTDKSYSDLFKPAGKVHFVKLRVGFWNLVHVTVLLSTLCSKRTL